LTAKIDINDVLLKSGDVYKINSIKILRREPRMKKIRYEPIFYTDHLTLTAGGLV